jgi:hypothetical protein
MGSTDTGDFFPDDYNREDEIAFTEGGSKGPQLPGMENLGADAIVQGGVTVSSEIPPGMQFIPSSVPDGVVEFTVGSTSGTYMRTYMHTCIYISKTIEIAIHTHLNYYCPNQLHLRFFDNGNSSTRLHDI